MLLVGLDRMRTLDMYSGLVVAPLALLIIAASPEEFPASRVISFKATPMLCEKSVTDFRVHSVFAVVNCEGAPVGEHQAMVRLKARYNRSDHVQACLFSKLRIRLQLVASSLGAIIQSTVGHCFVLVAPQSFHSLRRIDTI